jgi:hypothetical protein
MPALVGTNVLSLWILPADRVNGHSWILRYHTLPLMVARRNVPQRTKEEIPSAAALVLRTAILALYIF